MLQPAFAGGYGGQGGLAQLVERLHGMQEVSGSNPLFSTLIIKGLCASINPFLLGGLNMV